MIPDDSNVEVIDLTSPNTAFDDNVGYEDAPEDEITQQPKRRKININIPQNCFELEKRVKVALYQSINHYWEVSQEQGMLAALLDSRFKDLEFASETLCLQTHEQLKDAYQNMKILTNESQGAESRPTSSNSLLARMFKNSHTYVNEISGSDHYQHLPNIAANFGILINTSVSIKEAVYRLYKRVVLYTNKKNISMDLSKQDNTLQTLRYLLDGGLDIRYNKINLFAKIIYDERLHNLLDNWYISDIVEDNTAESCSDIFSIHFDFQDIQILQKFTLIYIKILISDAIIQRHVDYYSSIRFTVKNGDVYSNITLRIGEAIDVKNVDDPNRCLYALIRAIMIH
ncbi:unnamed protein product [Rhizophagus irregularis]|nr:unnamed protein product [Rhizophagus irregularis]